MSIFNLFIDESCHLYHDRSNVMSIGYVKVAAEDMLEIKSNLKLIKNKHGIPHEFKWNTCSNTKKQFYIDLIDYFFSSPINFRSIVVKYKEKLDHDQFNQGSHDNFYYKMIYHLLNNIWVNHTSQACRVFLDIKDTRGSDKIAKIRHFFDNKYRGNSPFIHFQHIRSHESVFIQLTDFFIGAITYKSRGLHKLDNASPIKQFVVKYIEEKAGYALDEGTEPWEEKFNIFDHQPRSQR